MESTDNHPVKPGLSRKEFLNLTGRSLAGAAGTLALSSVISSRVYGQDRKQALSPPAEIPADVEKPVVLETWKSDADQQSAPTPTPLPPSRRIGYAVVGLGHLSLEEILPALSNCKKSKLTALVSGSPEKLKKVAAQYGITPENCYSYQTYDQLKNNKEVDVIYIVLPNGLHKEYVIRGAKAGKHILCEKPLANTSEECREMISACNKADVKLMVAYRIHYQPHNRKLREMIQKKEFEIPKFVEAHNSQSTANVNHWRHKKALAGGGALLLLCFGVIAAAPGWAATVPFIFLLGLGYYMVHNTLQTHATEMAPEARGSAVSSFAFCLFLGQAAGVSVLGLGVEWAGYRGAIAATGVGLAVLGFWFGRELRRL